ncbi:MAG: DNA-processing protein DprA [Deltaproteobacteria bacterium]|nr:DNA-processing protein DprA [Deltaproteobacteria bacterium]
MTVDANSGWLRLYLSPGLGRSSLVKLMSAFPNSEAALAAEPGEWFRRAGLSASLKKNILPEDEPSLVTARKILEKSQTQLIVFTDEDKYPSLLREIHDPPALLFQRGSCAFDACLAVVGSRRASSSHLRFTRELCSELAAKGLTIVSGLARGIDTAAHEGALAVNGKTMAVLGCGIDQVYPYENRHLFAQIAEQGNIISEYPPGARPLAHHFPVRNRIISGLSRGVLIVEASEKSGSLITAELALEQGREVFAVPGSVLSSNSRGVNQLLRQGAHLVTEPRDILEVLWPAKAGNPVLKSVRQEPPNLSPQEAEILALIDEQPSCLDDIVRKSGLTPSEVSARLLHLELAGLISRLPGMQFSKNQ